MKNIENLYIHTPNRPKPNGKELSILKNPRLDTPLSQYPDRIFLSQGSTGLLYEGVDHSEVLIMTDHYTRETGTSGDKIILVTIDAHNDITSGTYRYPHADLATWIRSAYAVNLFNNQFGVQYITRHSEQFGDLQTDQHYRQEQDFERTGIKVTIMDFDTMETNTDCKSTLQKILKYKQQGYHLLTTVDADAGSLTEKYQSDPYYYRDLSDIHTYPWLGELYRNTNALMYLLSPSHAPVEYVENLGIQLRNLHVNGYPKTRRN